MGSNKGGRRAKAGPPVRRQQLQQEPQEKVDADRTDWTSGDGSVEQQEGSGEEQGRSNDRTDGTYADQKTA